MLYEKKGITLVSLIITVIVMLIIAGTATYTGINDMKIAEENKLLSELEIVKQAVYQTYLNYQRTGNSAYIVGTKVDASSLASSMGITLVTIPNTETNETITSYYRLNPTQLKNIGIENSQDTYIVNYFTRRSYK